MHAFLFFERLFDDARARRAMHALNFVGLSISHEEWVYKLPFLLQHQVMNGRYPRPDGNKHENGGTGERIGFCNPEDQIIRPAQNSARKRDNPGDPGNDAYYMQYF